MIDFLLEHQFEFGCEDKQGIMACTLIDVFCDFAQEASKLKLVILSQGINPDQKLKDELELIKQYL